MYSFTITYVNSKPQAEALPLQDAGSDSVLPSVSSYSPTTAYLEQNPGASSPDGDLEHPINDKPSNEISSSCFIQIDIAMVVPRTDQTYLLLISIRC